MTNLEQKVRTLADSLSSRKIQCAVAESCTGGGLAAVMTDLAGSSRWFERGFVTYSNEAKHELLGVPKPLIEQCGAVSQEVACAMAEGAILYSAATASVAITGIAGPGGGSTQKPVGSVWIAWAGDWLPTKSKLFHFQGDRHQVREQAVIAALDGLIARCDHQAKARPLEGEHARYYFALWPSEKTAEALFQAVDRFVTPESGIRVLQKNLHLTLAFLGHIQPEVLDRVIARVAEVPIPAFTIQLDAIGYWACAAVKWLGMQTPSPALELLVTHLNAALLKEGYRPERRAFAPHVTITKKDKEALDLTHVPGVEWPVNEFCLVKSTAVSEPSQYDVMHRWQLHSPTN